MSEVLAARDLLLGYGDHQVLAGLQLGLGASECWGVVGPNGAGKSTLLRALSGALRPWGGTVLLDGRDISGLPSREVARRLAFMAAEVPEALPFRVREFVSFGRTPHQDWLGRQGEGDEQAVDHALAVTRTDVLQHRRLDELSSGERQRVQLAQALAQAPGVLLLDEPTAHLDLGYQVEMMRLLLTVASTGVCVVAILHDLNLAAAYCHRLVVLHDGGIVAVGTPQAVITEGLVATLYGGSVVVARHPQTGLPAVLPAR